MKINNPLRNPAQRAKVDVLVAIYLARGPALFRPGAIPYGRSSGGTRFWNGYAVAQGAAQVGLLIKPSPGSFGYPWWVAGYQCGLAAPLPGYDSLARKFAPSAAAPASA